MLKVTVEKFLTLHFELPGYRGGGSSRVSSHPGVQDTPWQLEHKHNSPEHWRLEIDASNAVETRDTLLKLAGEIDTAIALGLGTDAT